MQIVSCLFPLRVDSCDSFLIHHSQLFSPRTRNRSNGSEGNEEQATEGVASGLANDSICVLLKI